MKLSEFYDALLEAKGIQLEPDKVKKDGQDREPSYRLTVHQNEQIVIGAAYTQARGLVSGDEFQLKLVYKYPHLTQLGESNEDD